jgi:hypothetical protein
MQLKNKKNHQKEKNTIRPKQPQGNRVKTAGNPHINKPLEAAQKNNG